MDDAAGRQPIPDSDLLRLVVESAVDLAIMGMDLAGRVTLWNVGAKRLLGFGEDILGCSSDVMFTREDRTAGMPECERSEALRMGRAEGERWHQRKDGSRFWGSSMLMPLADRSGFMKIMRDLTEPQAAQEQLRASEELFRLLATNIPQLVFRTQGSGERTWASPQWCVFTGITFEQSLGLGWLDAVHPEDRDATVAAWVSARENHQYYVEHRIRQTSNGEYRWHQTRARPIDPEREDGDWVGTSCDVHEMRGLQERQRLLLGELQHRTRNLLAVVHAIERKTLRNSASLEDFTLEFEGRLRALSRVQTLLADADYGTIELGALIWSELSAHGADASEAGKVRVEGEPVCMPATLAQAMALALHELATNAVKYGALKQPTGRLTVTWRTEPGLGENRLALEWQEAGVQMPDASTRRARRGYGSELIERALPYQLKAETTLEFGPDGVHCRIAAVLPSKEARSG